LPDLFGNSRLKDELLSWEKAISSLSPDDKKTFEKALENAMQYSDFVEVASKGHETEALLLSILLSQQKKIEELKRAIGNNRKTQD
jgi:hypothetical protein